MLLYKYINFPKRRRKMNKFFLPENMGESCCLWRDELGECPTACPFLHICLDCPPSGAKIEALFHVFEKPKTKVFQKCEACTYSRPSWNKAYAYYCKKNKTYHPANGGCYVKNLTPKKEVKKETPKSWARDHDLLG
jgi:hypothetical protein